MARVRSVTGERVSPVESGWQVARCEPGAIERPADLDTRALAWLPAQVPGTVASALRDAKQGSPDGGPRIDASDWWFRAHVPGERDARASTLRLGGLATLAEVWWNGERVLSSDSMFQQHEVDVPALETNELAVRFAALDPALAARRGRPRWRSPLVEHTQLRWFRTSLLGRMPAWTPPVPPVGPWRAVSLVERGAVSVATADVRAACRGRDGEVHLRLGVRTSAAGPVEATARVGEDEGLLACIATSDGLSLEGTVRVRDVARWWPASHGAQPLYPVTVRLATGAGETVIDLGTVAFRDVRVRTDGGDFAFVVNDVEIFARGASWMPLDPASLTASASSYDAAIRSVRAGGMNMLRVPGVCPYEDDAFYDACDRHGLLVWQDLALASMDYPFADAAFAASLEREVEQQMNRLQTCGALVAVCGGSETEQQPAMLGLPRESWSAPFVSERLAPIVRARRPDVAFVASSPTGGALPFDANAGVSHYYGVGGYQRPLDDARRADVRFAAECLAFGNVPDDATLDRMLPDGVRPTTHPLWKAGVPRDAGASWDHDDIRDFYLRLLFDQDPAALRYADVTRYLAVSRVVTGEVIERTLAEWRRPASRCRGALLWTLRDLRLGAGFGVFDSTGARKAAFWYARRAFAPVALLLTDEGVNGVAAHLVNDRDVDLVGELHVALYRDEAVTSSGAGKVHVAARGGSTVPLQTLVDRFVDATYAYRFGPPGHDVVAVRLVDSSGATLARAHHLPLGLGRPCLPDLGLTATAARAGESVQVTLTTRTFAQSIAIEAPGWQPDDAYFHLEPGGERVVTFTPDDATRAAAAFRAAFAPLNGQKVARVSVAAVAS